MLSMGFSEKESVVYLEEMQRLHPKYKEKELCWLIMKYAANKIGCVISPKQVVLASLEAELISF
jgi:hypothetical protein